MNINPMQIPSYMDLVPAVNAHMVDAASAKIVETFALAAGLTQTLQNMTIVVADTNSDGLNDDDGDGNTNDTFQQPSWIADKSAGKKTLFNTHMRAARAGLGAAMAALRMVMELGDFDQQ